MLIVCESWWRSDEVSKMLNTARAAETRAPRPTSTRSLCHALAHNAAQLLLTLANPPSHLPLYRPRHL